MVSTRLQSNCNSSSGDSSMLPPADSGVPNTSATTSKHSYGTGCVTRSGTSTHPVPHHNKDAVVLPKGCTNSADVSIKSGTNLMNLPVEIIEQIVTHCGYNTASNLRLVNRKMDQICGSLLNLTFNKLQNSILARFQSIKAQMPRREAARRQHPLACEFDIIETIQMRLNLLHMTFGKHIERKLMYFFPGEVLDEVYRILYYIKVTPKLPRPFIVTDELFDLTNMAMEHFKEKLEPKLPEITYWANDLINYSPLRISPANCSNNRILFDDKSWSMDFSASITEEDSFKACQPQSNMVLRKRIRKIKLGMKLYNSQLTTMKRELKAYKMKMADQQKTILDYATRLDDNDKKSEEMSRKYSTLLQELNKCKTELQYWRSKSPLNPACGACGAPVASVPIEDLEALSNQGIVIPMVMVRPLPINEGELVDTNKLDEASAKESRQSCKDEDAVHPSKGESTAGTSNSDPNSCDTESGSDNSDSDTSKKRTVKPAKRKQLSDKQTSCKRPRGILKLRSKTIRIMK